MPPSDKSVPAEPVERRNSDAVFSDAVKAAQQARGSRRAYSRRDFGREITEDLAGFIAAIDSFYLASASLGGQPTIQHRGGPKGFLRVLGPTTLGFADFAGNRQYISIGNISENPKVMLFLMDYPGRQRIKIWGDARVIEDDPVLLQQLMPEGYQARPERAIVIEITAIDVNCPQHITPRYDEATVRGVTAKLTERVDELEAEVARLKGRLESERS